MGLWTRLTLSGVIVVTKRMNCFTIVNLPKLDFSRREITNSELLKIRLFRNDETVVMGDGELRNSLRFVLTYNSDGFGFVSAGYDNSSYEIH
jgi:hypothetical protein